MGAVVDSSSRHTHDHNKPDIERNPTAVAASVAVSFQKHVHPVGAAVDAEMPLTESLTRPRVGVKHRDVTPSL